MALIPKAERIKLEDDTFEILHSWHINTDQYVLTKTGIELDGKDETTGTLYITLVAKEDMDKDSDRKLLHLFSTFDRATYKIISYQNPFFM